MDKNQELMDELMELSTISITKEWRK